MLDEIVAELARPPEDATPISASTVRRWMTDAEGEARGATYDLLTYSRCLERIVPPLCFDEVFDWLLSYYEWCLRADPQHEWGSTRWDAAWEIVVWFVGLWDSGRDRSYLERIRDFLAHLYLTGSPDLKKALEHGCLEHLFERKRIREFFESWRIHPKLAAAYEEASLWARYGGKSPWSGLQEPDGEDAT